MRLRVALPDIRDPSRLPQPSVELLHRIAEARGTLVVQAVPPALQPLIERPRDKKGWIVVAVVAVVTTVVTYYLFEHYLQVLLPRGRWTDF